MDGQQFLNLRPNPKTLVLSGGGMNGLLHLGALQFFYERQFLSEITEWIGTSIGAVIALLLALKYTPHQIFQMAQKFNYTQLQDIKLVNLTQNFGLDTGQKLRHHLASLFPSHISPSITFAELHSQYNQQLIITATPLEYPPAINPQPMVFSYQTTPNVSIIDACMASTALPLIFSSPIILNQRYIDGGILDNCPTFASTHPIEQTLTLNIMYNNVSQPAKNPQNWQQYVYALLITIHRRSQPTRQTDQVCQLKVNNSESQIITIDTSPVHKLTLFLDGYQQALTWWDPLYQLV